MRTVTISREEYDALKADKERLERENAILREWRRLLLLKRFGASSEKSDYDAEQLSLFNEAEFFFESKAEEPELQVVEKHYRQKRRELPGKLPEDLPLEIVEHILPENERICPCCGGELHDMGKETVRRELKLIPAKAVAVEHVRHAYACRYCEKTGISVPILKAPVPKSVIPASFATPEALAHVITQKFMMGIPLYRQEQEWKRQGVELSRQTLSNWLIRGTEAWLLPLYEAMKRLLLQRDVLHADETTLQVLREPGKAAHSKSYRWLYRTGSDAEHPLILYEYQSSRKAEHVRHFLNGWKGYLHADGYSGYHTLDPGITVVGCWAHARRKFDEALKVLAEKDRPGSGAMEGFLHCDRLFALEKKLADLSPEERHEQRQTLAKPLLDEFRAWLLCQKIGKGAFAKAVRYALDQWKYLANYLLDGRLELSNNRAERSIKPFVIGRKNFLFANTPKGAQVSAVLYSLVETAKESGLNPYEYFTFLFSELPNRADLEDASVWAIDNYLPGGALVPPRCHIPTSAPDKATPLGG
jgi:transposase